LLIFVFLAADIISIVTTARVTAELHFSVNELLHPLLGCDSEEVPLSPYITVPAWAGMITFDSVIFMLTLVKAVRTYRSLRTPLLTVLIRDGFLYYCVMLAIAIVNLVVLRSLIVTHSILATGVVILLLASFSIIGSRMLLNMRGVISDSDRAASGGFSSGATANNAPWEVRMNNLTDASGAGVLTTQVDELQTWYGSSATATAIGSSSHGHGHAPEASRHTEDSAA